METKLIRCFLFSSAILLLITSVAKFVSANGGAHILQMPDPVLAVSFQQLFWFLGIVELLVACSVFFGKRLELQATLVGWLATIFLLYRIGLLVADYPKPCPCMGSLTDALHIPPQIAGTAMKIILAYLLIGSYASLFWLWRQKRRAGSAPTPSTPSASAPAP